MSGSFIPPTRLLNDRTTKRAIW